MMKSTIDCGRCDKPRNKGLVAGKKVCDSCPDWRAECEAQDLLGRSLQERRHYLQQVEYHRGKDAAEALKQVILMLWEKKRPTE